MRYDDTQLESGAADRLLFFSDAVVAIAITLLALELPVPSGPTTRAFWNSVSRNDGSYLAFLISFVVIAVAWSQHHHVMRFVERSDSRLRTLNMLWLLTIILNPFATKLLTTEGHDSLDTHALRYGFYAVLQVIASATFVGMLHHVTARHLESADLPPDLVNQTDLQALGVIAGFGLSIPVFFLDAHAWLLWIAGPVIAGQIARHRARRHNAA